MKSAAPIIRIENLAVEFADAGANVHALRGIALSLSADEIHGLVGESGSGKTVTAMALMGLLPPSTSKIVSGSIQLKEESLLSKTEEELRAVRGSKISMVFQEPAKFLNPAFTIGTQIAETVRQHLGMGPAQARARALELLELVGLGSDGRVARAFPHELSSGMKQRAMIAIAISCEPELLIADEPTTSLDVTLQAQILGLLKSIKASRHMGMLFISHDLSVVREIADRVSVIYAGTIVESGPRERIFAKPLHPYTALLLRSIPDPRKKGTKLTAIQGQVLDPKEEPRGCVFAPRCPLAKDRCRIEKPECTEREPDHASACHFWGESWKL